MPWSEDFNGVPEIPTEAARLWNCKWLVDVDKNLYTTDGNLKPTEELGYVYLEIEMYGFDLYTFLLVQKDDQFEDFSVSSDTNVPKLYLMKTSQKYIMPPQYD